MRTKAAIAAESEAHAEDGARFLATHHAYVPATTDEAEAHAQDLARFVERHDARTAELYAEAQLATE